MVTVLACAHLLEAPLRHPILCNLLTSMCLIRCPLAIGWEASGETMSVAHIVLRLQRTRSSVPRYVQAVSQTFTTVSLSTNAAVDLPRLRFFETPFGEFQLSAGAGLAETSINTPVTGIRSFLHPPLSPSTHRGRILFALVVFSGTPALLPFLSTQAGFPVMYFSKVLATAALLLSASLGVSAHAAIAPVLGVAGTPARNDVQRPSTAKPCGNTNIAKTLDTSGVITMRADNTFDATITNFNKGVDGSRQITSALVDVTGTGKSFAKATVTKNGTKNPTNVGSEQLTIALPAACSGGATKNKCLVSLKTAGGFGNCVVVQNAATTKRTETDAPRRAAPRSGPSRHPEIE